jgi:HD-GYP domain-containing protein (c-di-GMP phosphodiesterase class II)
VALWLMLGLIAHALEFELPLGPNVQIFLSPGFAISSAAIAMLPPAGAMIAVAFGSITINQITQSPRPLWTLVFNRAALALCAAAGAAVFHAVSSLLPFSDLVQLVGGTVAASSVYVLVSLVLAGTAAALRSGRPLRRAWVWPLVGSPGFFLNYVALGLLGDLILTMLRVGGIVGLLLALIPLALSYISLRSNAYMRQLYNAIVATLVDSLDLRDHDTGGHTRRVAALAVRLGAKLGLRGRQLEDLRTAALLHDLGKIGVADSILLKPSKLTAEEWEEMKKHPERGAQLLEARGLFGGAIPLIRAHQEHFDGSGYPDQLRGDAIPLGARIITIADSFMAMVDGRPYRAAIPAEEAFKELAKWSGRQFDPRIIQIFTMEDWQAVLADHA